MSETENKLSVEELEAMAKEKTSRIYIVSGPHKNKLREMKVLKDLSGNYLAFTDWVLGSYEVVTEKPDIIILRRRS